jgi:hypothetical protein
MVTDRPAHNCRHRQREWTVETDQTVEDMVNAATDADDVGDEAETVAKKNQGHDYIEQDT